MNGANFFLILHEIFGFGRLHKLRAAMTKAAIIPRHYQNLSTLDAAAIIYAMATIKTTDHVIAGALLAKNIVSPGYNDTIRNLQFWLQAGGEDLRFALIFENGCGVFEYMDGRHEISLGHTKEVSPLTGEPLYIAGSVFETLQNAVQNEGL
jgi:hypothetical protein